MQSLFSSIQILLLCWFSRASPECNVAELETPIQCQETSTLSKSAIYSLSLSSLYAASSSISSYSSTTAINVKVSMTVCQSLDSPGPKWYKLEAISELTNAPAGTFDKPNFRSEAHHCEGSIIFGTCESSLLDLPRSYKWKAPADNLGKICFRLTILKDGMETCEQVDKCIHPEGELSSGYEYFSGDDVNSSGKLYREETETIINNDEELVKGNSQSSEQECNIKINCTNKKLRAVCGSDGHTYPNKCAFRWHKCVTGYTHLRSSPGACATEPPPTEPPITPYCWEQRAIIPPEFDWGQKCTCDGTYKLVQCAGNNCWCSSLRGYQTSKRINWSCQDPTVDDLQCNVVL